MLLPYGLQSSSVSRYCIQTYLQLLIEKWKEYTFCLLYVGKIQLLLCPIPAKGQFLHCRGTLHPVRANLPVLTWIDRTTP